MILKSSIKLIDEKTIKSAFKIQDFNLINLSKKHFNHFKEESQINASNKNNINNNNIISKLNKNSNINSNKKIFLISTIEKNKKQISNKNLSYFSFTTTNNSNESKNNNNQRKSSSTSSSTKSSTSPADSLTREELEKQKNKKLTNKLDTIFKNEFNDKVNNQKEYEFILNKIRPFNIFYKYLRFPVFAILLPMPWLNPFSTAYSVALIASNYYMILLTLIESSVFFGAGLTYYLITMESYSFKKNLVSLRDKRNFKRMAVAFIHFSLIMLSAVLANSYSNQYSLMLLLLGNAYLYGKYSYHILLKLFPKELFEQRMMMIFMNCGLCVGLLLVISWKKYLHKMIA